MIDWPLGADQDVGASVAGNPDALVPFGVDRFGIVRVDYGTQERTVKRSGLWYRDHIAAVWRGV